VQREVHQGVIFDVYQWEQEMYDGSIKIFEKLKTPGYCSGFTCIA